MYHVNHDGLERLVIPNAQVTPTIGGTKAKQQETIRYIIFRELHRTSLMRHRGKNATLKMIRDRFYWPNMHKDVAKFYNACDLCQSNKIDRQQPKGLLINIEQPVAPGRVYNMDFATDLPRSLKLRDV